MRTDFFDYQLPQELIAQTPVTPRDSSRLLVLDRASGSIEHRNFSDIGDYLSAGDMLVANNSRVIPARIFGNRLNEQDERGGRIEILLLKQRSDLVWEALIRGRRMKVGKRIGLLSSDDAPSPITATIIEQMDGPLRLIEFSEALDDQLAQLGHVPLPPYIDTQLNDPERYQTIYAEPAGSAAAPTAGLHFTPDLLFSLRNQKVKFETVTLHVGLDTFQPVKAEAIVDHEIHHEWATLSPSTAQRINQSKLAGNRIVAVGTTSVRVLETAALRSAGLMGSLQNISVQDAAGETTAYCPWRPVAAFEGPTDLYLYPGYRYRAVDAMITNFHLPQSTLLMLVSAFAGRELIMEAYAEAINKAYRFFSFGDAMLIL